MNLNLYLKQNRIKVKNLSDSAGIPYTTLGDIVRGKTDIDNVSVKVLVKLSKTLGLSMMSVYNLAKETAPTPELEDDYRIEMKNATYYIVKDGKRDVLCENRPEYAYYIKDIAETYISNKKSDERMNSWKAMYQDT